MHAMLDPKALNVFIQAQKFCMESTKYVITSLHQRDFCGHQGCKPASLHPAHQCFLHFAVGPLHYQFMALPFGLSSALLVLSKMLAPVLALVRSCGILIV